MLFLVWKLIWLLLHQQLFGYLIMIKFAGFDIFAHVSIGVWTIIQFSGLYLSGSTVFVHIWGIALCVISIQLGVYFTKRVEYYGVLIENKLFPVTIGAIVLVISRFRKVGFLKKKLVMPSWMKSDCKAIWL